MKNKLSQLIPCLLLSAFILLPAAVSFAGPSGPKMTDTITFRVNMKYMIGDGSFNPATDTVDISGTMNGWSGADLLQREGTSDIYQIRFELLAGTVASYKYQVRRADTIITEDITDNTTRKYRVPDTTSSVTAFFSNYNPASVPMTFICDMYYQVKAGHFTEFSDYLDVAGNFNNEGANDVLFNLGDDSLFRVTLFLDTALVGGPPLQFKFRINGSWATSELQGDSSRTYTLTGTNDSFTAWFDNIDPSVPALPIAYDLIIQDTLNPNIAVTGSYRYEDYNLKPEGNSVYQWYVADSIGGPVTLIDSADLVTYTIDSAYVGKYLVFEVTPVTQDSIAGLPVKAYSSSVISYTGIGEKNPFSAKIFPNPANDELFIESEIPIEKLELINSMGSIILSQDGRHQTQFRLQVGGLSPGTYFLRLTGRTSSCSTYTVIIR
jgi:hypothetical protein